MNVQIALLAKQHNRAEFCCGDEEMDDFVHHFLAQQVRAGETTCYVLEDDQTYAMIGFFTLNPLSIPKNDLPEGKRLAYPEASVYLLGRLAVDRRYQGMGYGALMVREAVSLLHGQNVPRGLGLLTELKNDQLKEFYSRLGFIQIEPNRASGRIRMFLPFVRPGKLPSR